MAGYGTIAQMLTNLAGGSSKHRSARVLRFVHRHRDSHAHIIGRLRQHKQRQQRRAAKRFARMQAAA